MFESKLWYEEVTLLIVIPQIIGSFFTYVIYIGLVAWLIVALIFIGLAVWRVVRKKFTVKEVIVTKLLHIALGLVIGLLLPYYLAVFLIVGLLFLIISRIHKRAVRRVTSHPIRNRIAVVNYEQELADIFAEAIRGAAYKVDVFTNSVLASEIIGSQHSIYSLVLIAWRMPGLSGYELAQHLSKIDPEIKIILTSALGPDTVVEFDHISLPVTMPELLEKINNKIKSGKMNDEPV